MARNALGIHVYVLQFHAQRISYQSHDFIQMGVSLCDHMIMNMIKFLFPWQLWTFFSFHFYALHCCSVTAQWTLDTDMCENGPFMKIIFDVYQYGTMSKTFYYQSLQFE